MDIYFNIYVLKQKWQQKIPIAVDYTVAKPLSVTRYIFYEIKQSSKLLSEQRNILHIKQKVQTKPKTDQARHNQKHDNRMNQV
uniref:Uncharacterized protein n=1 Tax=Arion vulgaris TaxID=1028688 RepID=A0A0B6ZND1_9EUPU